MWPMALVAALLVSTLASAESDPELLAKGAAALRMLEQRTPPQPSGALPPESRVYKGNLSNVGDVPYAAFATIYGRACSSTIVHDYFVLLSKWCTQARPTIGMVFAGGTQFTNIDDLMPADVQIREIERWWIHSWLPPTVWHDITLARLFTPFKFGDAVDFVPITSLNTFGSSSRKCRMSGYGEAVLGDRQHVLHTALIEVVNYKSCQEVVGTQGIPIAENALCCVKVSKYSMCEGDGGGPLVCSGFLFGTNSDKVPLGAKLIRECGERVVANYFMFMGYYHDWIESTIHNFTPSPHQPLKRQRQREHEQKQNLKRSCAPTVLISSLTDWKWRYLLAVLLVQ